MSACADGRPARLLSISRWISSASSSLSVFPFVKVAIKAGREPPKVSDTKLFALSLVKLFFGDQDDDSTAVILKDAALAEPFEHCVGCRALPAKLRFTDFYQAACADGGGLPYDIRKAPLHQS